MIFIVLCAIALLIALWWFFEAGIGAALFMLFISSIVGGFIFAIIWGITGASGIYVPYKDETSHDLQAMGNADGLDGGFFLGSGYVSDKAVITYIEKLDNGGSQLKRVDAAYSTVYEVDESPKLITRNYSGSPWWLAPFDLYSGQQHEFRVPNGTVTESFELSTK